MRVGVAVGEALDDELPEEDCDTNDENVPLHDGVLLAEAVCVAVLEAVDEDEAVLVTVELRVRVREPLDVTVDDALPDEDDDADGVLLLLPDAEDDGLRVFVGVPVGEAVEDTLPEAD